MPEQSNDYRVVVFGAGGVGKSSLVLRFVKGTFRDTYIPTIEDTYRQVISCDKSVCTLQITDTTGSHQSQTTPLTPVPTDWWGALRAGSQAARQ
ncbi:GTP-binding protein Di-Ras1, partial [Eschrichtius robustus]|nr:GTP-binding protein Di-Ras1 [Eschrichtius robustus]